MFLADVTTQAGAGKLYRQVWANKWRNSYGMEGRGKLEKSQETVPIKDGEADPNQTTVGPCEPGFWA